MTAKSGYTYLDIEVVTELSASIWDSNFLYPYPFLLSRRLVKKRAGFS